VLLAGFAPAFTLSFHDSERSHKPQVRIGSVVISLPEKNWLMNDKLTYDFIERTKERYLNLIILTNEKNFTLRNRIALQLYAFFSKHPDNRQLFRSQNPI